MRDREIEDYLAALQQRYNDAEMAGALDQPIPPRPEIDSPIGDTSSHVSDAQERCPDWLDQSDNRAGWNVADMTHSTTGYTVTPVQQRPMGELVQRVTRIYAHQLADPPPRGAYACGCDADSACSWCTTMYY